MAFLFLPIQMKRKLKRVLGAIVFAPILAVLFPIYFIGMVTAAVVDAFNTGFTNCESNVRDFVEWIER